MLVPGQTLAAVASAGGVPGVELLPGIGQVTTAAAGAYLEAGGQDLEAVVLAVAVAAEAALVVSADHAVVPEAALAVEDSVPAAVSSSSTSQSAQATG